MMQNEEVKSRVLLAVSGIVAIIEIVREDGAPWDADLGNAKECLGEAMAKLLAVVDPPAFVGADDVSGNNAAGRELEILGQPVKFGALPVGSTASAVKLMINIKNQRGMDVVWRSEDELLAEVRAGYDPGNHFSFLLFPSGAVAVRAQ
jgi:phage terminase large subunit-like protein